MSKLLYIESSPRKNRSKSIAASKVFLDEYRKSHPTDEVITLDLWERRLPEFDGFTIDAKYAVLHGQDFTSEQQQSWQEIVNICEEFKSADKYVISLPMWNFGVPYKLKHYIDVIAQPGLTFSFDPSTGYSGLVTGKPVTVFYARGGAYKSEEERGMDFQRSYIELLLGFIGFNDIQTILIEPTLGASEDVNQVEATALERARSIASTF